MSAVVVAFEALKPNPQRPWQNHELAELYRAVDILCKAGLPIDTDMGMSDEGDPWFVFVRADTGEVIVHCARINSLFVANSIAIDQTFRGANFREVIDSIVRYEPLKMPMVTTGPKLYLHPVMVLAAFVATALLFTKKADAQDLHSALVSLTPQDSHSGHKGFAAVKAAVGDFLQSIAWPGGASAGSSAKPLTEAEAPTSLATLMAAAMTIISPAAEAAGTVDLSASSAATVLQQAELNAVVPTHVVAAQIPMTADHAPAAPAPEVSSYQAWVSTLMAGPAKGAELKPIMTSLIAPPPAPEAATDTAPPAPASHFTAPTGPDFTHAVFLAQKIVAPPAVAVAGSDQPAAQAQHAAGAYAIDLNDISQVAIAIFFGPADGQPLGDAATLLRARSLATHATTVATTTGTHASVTSSSTSGNASVGAATDPQATPGDGPGISGTVTTTAPQAPTPDDSVPSTIVLGSDPGLGLSQMVHYAQGNHPLGSFALINPVPDFAAALLSYNADLGHAARLVVFDSADIKLPYFEFARGVLLVEDHELGINPNPGQLAGATTVELASGGTMRLLGVIDSGTLHIA